MSEDEENEEEKVFRQLKKVAEDIRFNFAASTVVVLVERIDENGDFSEHRITKGSCLAAVGLCRNYVIKQDQAARDEGAS